MTRLFVDFLDIAVTSGIQLHLKDMTCVCWRDIGRHLHHDRQQAVRRKKRRTEGQVMSAAEEEKDTGTIFTRSADTERVAACLVS
ncbi:hypothetical protein T484DRAFT_1861589 [Baffinella frigidus]|nr:hypothetical protein T484DRAFT_1861589 [Cryptophyta sp. CCMP2293]